MSKTLTYSADYPYPVETIFAQGSRRDYILAEAEFLDHQEPQLLALDEDSPAGGQLTLRYKVNTDLPGWAKKILPARNTITEHHTWAGPAADGSRTYSFDVDIATVPAKAKGTVRIVTAGESACTVNATIEVTANMPMVGGKLQDLVIRDLGPTVEQKLEFMSKWMAEQA